MSYLLQMRSNGQVIATGSGIIGTSPSGKPALLTNWHNVTGKRPDTGQSLDPNGRLPDELKIYHLRDLPNNQIAWVEKLEPLQDDQMKPLWHEHPLHGKKVDAVALPLTELQDVKILPYLGKGIQSPRIRCGPAEVVSVIGFPFGLTGGGVLAIWATGFVASEPSVDQLGLPMFLVDCRTRQGQSGSAVVAFRGGGMVAMEDGSAAAFAGGSACRFLGLYSGRVNKDSDLGMVWKESALLEILATVT